MPLRAVADDGHLLRLDECKVRGVVVVEISHSVLLLAGEQPISVKQTCEMFRDARTCVQILKTFSGEDNGAYFIFETSDSSAELSISSSGGRNKSLPRVMEMRPVRAISRTPNGRSTSSKPSILSTAPDTSII